MNYTNSVISAKRSEYIYFELHPDEVTLRGPDLDDETVLAINVKMIVVVHFSKFLYLHLSEHGMTLGSAFPFARYHVIVMLDAGGAFERGFQPFMTPQVIPTSRAQIIQVTDLSPTEVWDLALTFLNSLSKSNHIVIHNTILRHLQKCNNRAWKLEVNHAHLPQLRLMSISFVFPGQLEPNLD
ncbi:hypothetical protein L218DRAFT_1001238 [Marasmius fiardii PR-910]|nr:hypothetical protein L218DRAFT_1001238 [Marasmius fiardii PR-910]